MFRALLAFCVPYWQFNSLFGIYLNKLATRSIFRSLLAEKTFQITSREQNGPQVGELMIARPNDAELRCLAVAARVGESHARHPLLGHGLADQIRRKEVPNRGAGFIRETTARETFQDRASKLNCGRHTKFAGLRRLARGWLRAEEPLQRAEVLATHEDEAGLRRRRGRGLCLVSSIREGRASNIRT
jgi:hypothetical protein